MRVRRVQTDDSMDMLLDTITNMFGGIIFIAILVALLTGSQADRTAGRVEAAAGRLVTLRTDLDEGRARVSRKSDLATYLQGLAGQPDVRWDDTLVSLATDVDAGRRRLAQAERQLAHLHDKQAPIDEKLHLASEQTDRLRDEIEQLTAAFRREKDLRRLEARLPVAQITTKRPAHIVLTRGRMFIVDGCDGGLNTIVEEKARDVELVPLPQERTKIVLRSGGGLPVGGNLASTVRWRRLREAAPTARYFLYLVVLPDAHEAFLTLRQLAVSAGYDYDVVPLSADNPLILSPASQFHTQ